MRHSLPLVLSLVALGCTSESADDPSSAEADLASGDASFTAKVETALKTSTADSSTLPAASVCRVPAGTTLAVRGLSTLGRHSTGRLVTARTSCGANFAAGSQVYFFADHFSANGGAGATPPSPAPTGGSCDPSRARGVVAAPQKALLDTIAYAEGTRGRGQDGYNVIFTYQYFTSCTVHPRRLACSGSLCSDAAGRYQFLSTTWAGLGLASFTPDNQERGALKLIAQRGASVPSTRVLSATEFANVMDRISFEWASLPPGRYGQPNYSVSALRAEYCRLGGC